MSKKIPVWTFADMSVDTVAKFLNDHQIQPGNFTVMGLDPDYVRIIYLAAQI